MADYTDAFDRVRSYQQRVQGARPDGMGQYGPVFQSARDEYAKRLEAERRKAAEANAAKFYNMAAGMYGQLSGAGNLPFAPAADATQRYVQRLAASRGWTGAQWNALHKLIQNESGWRLYAQNPSSSAADLFQFLDGTRANYGIRLHDTLERQSRAGLQYIADRYGDPVRALQHWLAAKPINGRNVGHWY
jgi:hypothetical protein